MARALHAGSQSARGVRSSGKPTALPSRKTRIESELFGHVRVRSPARRRPSAAVRARRRRYAVPSTRSATWSLRTQSKVLRTRRAAIRAGRLRGVDRADVRVLAATNKRLEAGSNRRLSRRPVLTGLNVILGIPRLGKERLGRRARAGRAFQPRIPLANRKPPANLRRPRSNVMQALHLARKRARTPQHGRTRHHMHSR